MPVAMTADAGAPSRALSTRRAVLVSGAALGAGAVVVQLRAHQLLPGALAALLAVIALVSFPTAATLSGRIFLSGTAVLGWNQVLWWVHMPGDRIGWALALVVAAATCHALWRAGTKATYVLAPKITGLDLVPGGALLAGLGCTAHDLRSSNPAALLSQLLPGWDNAGHFAMYASIQRHGATVDTLRPPPGGGSWNYIHYPEAFHATTVSLAQLLWPSAGNDGGTLLVTYVHAEAILLVVTATVLVAGLVSLPTLRGRLDVAAPLSVLLFGVFVLGLGRSLVDSGFAAFLYPCAMAGAGMLVVLRWDSVRQIVPAVALGGAVTGVAHGWLPLLPLLCPFALALLFPLRRERLRAPRWTWVALALVAVATAWAVWRAVLIVAGGSVAHSLTASGDIVPLSPWVVLTLLVAPLVIVFLPRPGGATVEGVTALSRLRIGFLAVPLAIVGLLVLAQIQVRAHGYLSYYFFKYLDGVVLASAVLTLLLLAARTRPRSALAHRPRLLAAMCAVLVVVALPISALTAIGKYGSEAAPAGRDAVQWQASARELVRAVRVTRSDGISLTYLSSSGKADRMLTALWYVAMTDGWTSDASVDAQALWRTSPHRGQELVAARGWLAHRHGHLLVAPDLRRALGRDPATRQELSRVQSW